MDIKNLSIKTAGVQDAADILALQKLAFQSEAELSNDFNIPPLTQTLDSLKTDFQRMVFLKASLDGQIIGSVRGYLQNGTCHIGRAIVHPDFQKRGIGTRLIGAIEAQFNTAQRFELFTGQNSVRNIALYQKLGYRIFRTERLTDKVTVVYMEKERNAID